MLNDAQNKAGSTEGDGKEYLIFTLANQEYGIDILKVQEIRGYADQSVSLLLSKA